MNMVLGVWMSTIVLAPIGAFFTYKSNNDSVVFNAEVYINFFRMLLGLRPRAMYSKRSYYRRSGLSTHTNRTGETMQHL